MVVTPPDRAALIEVMARALCKAEDDGISDAFVEHIFSATVHDGDCTKQCHSCFVCITQMYREEAMVLLAAMEAAGVVVVPKKCTKPMALSAAEILLTFSAPFSKAYKAMLAASPYRSK